MRSFIALAAICGVACAADNYTVDASTLDSSDKTTWCNSQFNTCTQLCDAGGDGTQVDRCDPETLEYECTCKNGTAPGLEYYANSMETILCQKRFELCIEDTVGDSAGQAACATDIKDTCGTLNPAEATAPESSSDDSTTTSGDDSPSETDSGSDTTTTTDSGAVPTNIHHYGNAAGAVAIGLLAYML